MEARLRACTLRSWKLDDAESLARHANNPRVARTLRDRFPHPYTIEIARAWLPTVASAEPVTSFAIEADGEAVGGIGLSMGTDVARRSVEIGYWLSEDYWGRGIMTEAVAAAAEFGFANLDICRMYAHTFSNNPASARVLEKAGFTFEGRLRKSVFKNGEFLDELIYARIT
jgi:[ribosomal protein S5]-alanine N-acetyltransferase